MKKLEDEADIGTRRQHYLERIEAAFEAAAKASDPETIAGWKQGRRIPAAPQPPAIQSAHGSRTS